MEKRVILAIGLCVAVMIAWTKFFPVRPPTPAPVAQTAPAATPRGGQTDRRWRTFGPVGRPRGRADHQSPRAEGRARYARRSVRVLQPGRDPSARRAAQREVPRPTAGRGQRARSGGDFGFPGGPAADDLPEVGISRTGRRFLGDTPAGSEHGGLRDRHRERPYREALRRRHHPLPPPSGRDGHQPRRAAGRSPPGHLAVWPARSGEEGRGLHVGVGGQHRVDALRGRRQGRTQANREARQGSLDKLGGGEVGRHRREVLSPGRCSLPRVTAARAWLRRDSAARWNRSGHAVVRGADRASAGDGRLSVRDLSRARR